MESSGLRIIGIDPGLNRTGWGVILLEKNIMSFVAAGLISTNSEDSLAKRLNDIYHGLNEVVSKYKPNEVAVEETFINNNPISSLKLGHARGAIILAASLKQIKIFEYTTTAVKKAVVGVGRADKNQVSTMIKYLLPKANFKNEDESDALAVAICHINHRNFNKIIEPFLNFV